MKKSGSGSGATTTTSCVMFATTGSLAPRRLARASSVRRGITSTISNSSCLGSGSQRTRSPHTMLSLRPEGRARSCAPAASRTSRCRPKAATTSASNTSASRPAFIPCSIASFHMPSSDYLVWIDLEMTGLKPDTDVIIEMATIVTDSNLRIVAEGPVIAIHQPDSVLDGMDEWNKRTHGASGLLTRVRDSKWTMAMAESRTLEFLKALVEPNASPMCGNSICQDRRFLARHMPTLEKFFHYRNLDVSTLKELARRWAPGIIPGFSKQGEHKALADIQESIRELEYYRRQLFAESYQAP